MIRILSLIAASTLMLLVSGCTVHHSIGDSFGSYIAKPKGQEFKPVGARWNHEQTALLYVYRPATEWSMDELETPSFNVNSKRLFNMKGGAYTWYEMEPGKYDIVMRRGILGFEGVNSLVWDTLAEMSMTVQAGRVYYLRYSEIDPPKVTPDLTSLPQGTGPLQLVEPNLALAELPITRMLHKGAKRLSPAQAAAPAAGAVGDNIVNPAEAGSTPATKTKDEDWWPF